ncbi:MAG TPA: NAD+ synthase [Chloroflexota bacterium]|nr:NAD+ synthase [Chloroflexota bacterium]
MRILRVALVQMNATVGALRQNGDTIIAGVERARRAGADVVAFPELALTGYPPEDLVLKPEFVADNLRELDRLAAAVGDITAIVGFVDSDGSDIYNAAAVIQQGKVVGRHWKVKLPNYAVFDEQRYFRAGSDWSVYVVRGVKIGVTICEDIWYAVGPATFEALAGAEIIVAINASPYSHGRHQQRTNMVATRALDELAYFCYPNMVGGQDELIFEGASIICDHEGKVIAQGSFFEEDFLVANLDADAVFSARLHDVRHRQANIRPELLHAQGKVVTTPLAAPAPRRLPPLETPLKPNPQPAEEIYGALVLSTRDYVRKNGFRQVVIALSGGIDSTLTAAIAVDAVGAENVIGVSMPSRYSSEGSRTDAQQLAENLGIRFLTIPIEDAFRAYLDMLGEVFQGREPDITEENLQARVRGNILMALTNKLGGIVLTTGNKSEMAVGYSTLYGDLAGGFAVLKDVFKTTVWALARYRNAAAGWEIIPQSVIDKPPSAELRPDQLDQDSLPPYDVLDRILELYVEDDRSATDIVAMGFDPETVTRVIALVEHSEYKRRQAPPGPRITARAFGKDRRLPITNCYLDLPDVEEKSTLSAVAEEAEDEAKRRAGTAVS